MRTSARRIGLAVFVCILLFALGVSGPTAGAVGETTWISMIEQVTAEEVFVGTNSGISRSINGGETWHTVFPPAGFSGYVRINDISFDPNTQWRGYAVGQWANTSFTQYQSLILYTHDGGLTWERQDDEVGISEPELTAVDCDANSDKALYVGGGGQFGYTLDSGNTWTHHVDPGLNSYRDCSVNWDHNGDDLYGVLIGNCGKIAKVTDLDTAPMVLTNKNLGGTSEDLYGICENHAYNYASVVVGYGSFHLEGANNGTSWVRRNTFLPPLFHSDYYYSVDDYDTDEWYAAGLRHRTLPTVNDSPHIAHTDDGGNTWDYVTLPDTDNAITSISILPEEVGIREGWACSTSHLMHMASTSADRIAGDTRYETAASICEETLPGGLSRSAVLATGRNFADALSAAGLCGVYDAPLLLVGSTLGPALDELDRLNITDVYIVGGVGAVPQTIEDELIGYGVNVTRFAGVDRYATAAAVADEIVANGAAFNNTFFVARGDAFPDALAGAPFSYSSEIPILLTRPGSLPLATAKVIDDHANSLYILGGTGAVSAEVQADIDTLVFANSGNNSHRLAGANRYETARVIAEKGVGGSWASDSYIGVATGQNFPDALAGGVATGMMHGVIVLTGGTSLHSEAEEFISANATTDTDVRVFGGTGAVSEAVLDKIKTLY